MGQRKQYTASFKAKRLQESDHRKSPPENRRQSRRGRAPAGSQPEIFLGALQRTQGEIACRGNRVVSPTCRLASPGSQWFPRDADQQVREVSGFPEMPISKSGKALNPDFSGCESRKTWILA